MKTVLRSLLARTMEKSVLGISDSRSANYEHLLEAVAHHNQNCVSKIMRKQSKSFKMSFKGDDGQYLGKKCAEVGEKSSFTTF